MAYLVRILLLSYLRASFVETRAKLARQLHFHKLIYHRAIFRGRMLRTYLLWGNGLVLAHYSQLVAPLKTTLIAQCETKDAQVTRSLICQKIKIHKHVASVQLM